MDYIFIIFAFISLDYCISRLQFSSCFVISSSFRLCFDWFDFIDDADLRFVRDCLTLLSFLDYLRWLFLRFSPLWFLIIFFDFFLFSIRLLLSSDFRFRHFRFLLISAPLAFLIKYFSPPLISFVNCRHCRFRFFFTFSFAADYFWHVASLIISLRHFRFGHFSSIIFFSHYFDFIFAISIIDDFFYASCRFFADYEIHFQIIDSCFISTLSFLWCSLLPLSHFDWCMAPNIFWLPPIYFIFDYWCTYFRLICRFHLRHFTSFLAAMPRLIISMIFDWDAISRYYDFRRLFSHFRTPNIFASFHDASLHFLHDVHFLSLISLSVAYVLSLRWCAIFICRFSLFHFSADDFHDDSFLRLFLHFQRHWF